MPGKLLVNFPTNIGDTILGLPVMDKLRAVFPQARLIAISSPKTHELLKRNSFIDEVILFDKYWPWQRQLTFYLKLWGSYVFIADLKNSALPLLLPCRQATPSVRIPEKKIHVRFEYLKLISNLVMTDIYPRSKFKLTSEEISKWDSVKFSNPVFVACSSRSDLKQYPYEKLKLVVNELSSEKQIVIVGEEKDRLFYRDILTSRNTIDLLGKTALHEVFYIMEKYAALLLCVDSSIMHLAGYLNIPAVALFGPTDPARYGPWTDSSIVLKDTSQRCKSCQKSQYTWQSERMNIDPAEIIQAVRAKLRK